MTWKITIVLRSDDNGAARINATPDYTAVLFDAESLAVAEKEFFRLIVACRMMLGMWAEGLAVEELKDIASKSEPSDEEPD